MAIKFNFEGIAVSTDTAEEAFALIKSLRQPPQVLNTNAVVGATSSGTRAVESKSSSNIAIFAESRTSSSMRAPLLTLDFLKALKDAGTAGVDGQRMLQVMQVGHPKGVGSKIAMINDYLRIKHDVENVDEIYAGARGPKGKVWRAGPRLAEILEQTQQLAEQHAQKKGPPPDGGGPTS